MRFAHFAALAVSGALLATGPAAAASITVVADVNATSTANRPIYQNVLGTGTTVLFTDTIGQQGGTFSFFNSLAGVTATSTDATLTTSLLGTVDLLVVTEFYNNATDYSAAEIGTMADFVAGGGEILMVLESLNAVGLANYNALLAGLGSTIRYDGSRVSVSFLDTSLEDTPISSTSDSFVVGAYNILTGGQTVAQDGNGRTFVAYEDLSAIPLPAGLPLLAGGLGLLALARRRTAG